MKFLTLYGLALSALSLFMDPSTVPSSVQLADFGITAIILAVALVVTVAASLAMAFTMKPDIEDAEPSGLGDYGFPTNLESRYVPVVWGSTRIDGPNVIWYGDFRSKGLDTGGANVAFQYYLGIDQALCWGTVDSITALELDDQFIFKAGEQRAYTGGNVPLAGFVRPTGGHRRIAVLDSNFTGGPKYGGGISGNISFYYGTEDQPKSDYVAGVLGEETQTLANGSSVRKSELLPNYAGVARMVWEGGMLTERATAPKFKIHVQRFPTSLTASFSKVRDDGTTADANPIHVIYEILTDTNWGLAIDPNRINRQSFIDAAEQCHSEGLGYSRTIDNPKQAKGVIDDINDITNGMLYQNAEGLFEYRLARKTYVEGANAPLNYDGNLVVSQTLSHTGGGITTTSSPGAQVKLDAQVFYDALEVGDLAAIENVTDVSGVRYVEVVSKGTGNYFVYLTSATGEDLAADETVTTFSGELPDHEIRVHLYDAVPSLDPSSIIKVKSANRQAWDDTFNVIHLKYLDRTSEFKETVANAQDAGNMAIRKGVRKIKKVDLQGIRHPESAAIVAQRMLKMCAFPVTSVDLEVSRRYSYLRPGAIVEVNHPDFGLYNFYLRVLEVGLPKDTKGNVVLKGMRDVFDEPTNDTTIQVGGSGSLETIEPTPAVQPTSVVVTSLPEFYCQKLGLGATSSHAWHLVGAPNGTTTSGQAFQLTDGIYTEVSDQAILPVTGEVVGHIDDLWEDRDATWRYDRESLSTTNSRGGPYNWSPGPDTNPIRHNVSGHDRMVLGESNNAMFWKGASFGDIVVRNLSGSDDLFTGNSFTEEQIKNHGFGLALIRPAWANGDPMYDEIIAYTEATTYTFYRGEYNSISGSLITVTHPRPPDGQTFETHPTVSLQGVYRGLLDTGIQVINSGSEILFIGANDPMYDRVGQSGTLVGQTYRHAVYSVGSQTLPEDGSDQTVTADEMGRRFLPLPPTQIRIGNDSEKEAWGFGYFDNGEWQGYNVSHGGTLDNTLTINWRSHDRTQDPGVVKLYSENDVLVSSDTIDVKLELIDDDRTDDQNDRSRHSLAYYKEGWLPTEPALSHGLDGVVENQPFVAESTDLRDGTGGDGMSYATISNVQSLFPSATFTAGRVYYLCVSVRQRDSSNNVSRGAQRFLYRFQAATTTSP